MRKQLPLTIEDLMRVDDKIVLLFGDVGTYGFRNLQERFPERVYNVGILEQSMVSMAAGLAMQGFIPIVHTIATFLVERSFEQIKDDFGYQHLGGNFVSIGASYDMASWGATHQCPADVGLLKNIPDVEIALPGSPAEFETLFRQSYDDGRPTYFRLSHNTNIESYNVEFGKANIIQKGKKATIIAIGSILSKVKEACIGMDVTIIYYTTVRPFDQEALRKNFSGNKLIICEPYYSGAIATDIAETLRFRSVEISYIGVPREFIHHYGSVEDIDKLLGLTVAAIREKINNALGNMV